MPSDSPNPTVRLEEGSFLHRCEERDSEFVQTSDIRTQSTFPGRGKKHRIKDEHSRFLGKMERRAHPNPKLTKPSPPQLGTLSKTSTIDEDSSRARQRAIATWISFRNNHTTQSTTSGSDPGYASVKTEDTTELEKHGDIAGDERPLLTWADSETRFGIGSFARFDYYKPRILEPDYYEPYIPDFAKRLATTISQSIPIERFPVPSAAFLDLLRAFPERLRAETGLGFAHTLSYLIYRYRIRIADMVAESFSAKRSDFKEVDLQEPGHIGPVVDITSLYRSAADKARETDGVKSKDDAGREPDCSRLLQKCREAVEQSAAYEYLIKSAVNLVRFGIPGPDDAQTHIRRKVLGEKWEHPITGLTFQAPWIKRFLENQDYGIPSYEALDHVLVLVGTGNQAWATTCLQYVESIWPDIGTPILELYKSLLRKDAKYPGFCTLSDGTELMATTSPDEKTHEVNITGGECSIAKIVELLVWLNTSLSSPVVNDGIICQYPSCGVYRVRSPTSLRDPSTVCWPACTNIEVLRAPPTTASDGECWMNLFHSPTLVRGYPIPQRPNRHNGLEISLGLMLQLAKSRKVSSFSDHFLIKGFSTILVPTRRHENFIFWHMVFNEDGSYISYSDGRVKELLKEYPIGISDSDLGTSRHILGWCTKAENYAGAYDANYSIKWSRLKHPSPGCAFEKVTIVGGMFVTGGVSAAIGKKDKAVHIRSRDDYTLRLKWISRKFVVLYDVQERRAWLVDGASALLHLVRASLKHDLDGPFKRLFLYKESALHESLQPHIGKAAAISVLTNKVNMGIPLYGKPESSSEETRISEAGVHKTILSNTKTSYCLKDRVESICDLLEQIMAHQADVSTADGVGFKLKYSTRRQLEGFDFMDVATEESPLWPRAATLLPSGKGWVDFTRSIHAVTLFGTGFGDLIRPIQGGASGCRSCYANAEAPKGKDYLAVCVSELQDILQKRGNDTITPWRLVDDIYWHNPDKAFGPCHCAEIASTKHDRIQVLIPATIPRFLSRGLKSPPCLDSNPQAAFLFGHSWGFPLRWNDGGVSEEGNPDSALEEMVTPSHDSGIGTSQDSSSVNASNGGPLDSTNSNHPDVQQAQYLEPPQGVNQLHLERYRSHSPSRQSASLTTPMTTPDDAASGNPIQTTDLNSPDAPRTRYLRLLQVYNLSRAKIGRLRSRDRGSAGTKNSATGTGGAACTSRGTSWDRLLGPFASHLTQRKSNNKANSD